LFITAVPSIKLFAWGRVGIVKDMCYEIKKKLFEWGRVGIVKDMCYEIKKKSCSSGGGWG
jgi:hypothetical protein